MVGQKFLALQESAALSKHFSISGGKKAEWGMAQTLVSAWLWLPGLHFLAVCPWENFVVQSLTCAQLCNPKGCSMPGFSVLHSVLDFVQTHVHWINDAIQPYVAPFSSCLQSFPASESFPMSWLFASGGQSIGASASASVLPMNIVLKLYFQFLIYKPGMKTIPTSYGSWDNYMCWYT